LIDKEAHRMGGQCVYERKLCPACPKTLQRALEEYRWAIDAALLPESMKETCLANAQRFVRWASGEPVLPVAAALDEEILEPRSTIR